MVLSSKGWELRCTGIVFSLSNFCIGNWISQVINGKVYRLDLMDVFEKGFQINLSCSLRSNVVNRCRRQGF